MVWVLLVVMTISLIPAMAEEASTNELTEENTSETIATNQVVEISLTEVIETALKNNITWRLTNKQLELQNLQVEIADDLNNDLRKAERSLRQSEEMLSDSILAVQNEIAFVNGLNYPNNILDDQWAALTGSQISNTYIGKLTQQYGNVAVVKALSPDAFTSVLRSASEGSAAAFFEIRNGKNATIKQANATAASLMGLRATRELTMKESLELIETSAAHSAALLQKADEDARRGIELLAESSFYNVLKAQKMVIVQHKALERAEEQYNTALKSYNQGLLAKVDLQLAQLQLNNMKISAYGADVELNKAKMDFCVAVGWPLDQEFVLIEPQWVTEEISLVDGLAMAKDNRTDMITATQGLELAELNLEYVKENHKENTDEYSESVLYLEKQQLEYEQTWLNAQTVISKAYYDWQNADYAYQLTLANLGLVENQLHIAETSFDIGYSSGGSSPLAALLQAQEQVATIEQGLTAAEFGRNLAWQNFLKEIGYQLPTKQAE